MADGDLEADLRLLEGLTADQMQQLRDRLGDLVAEEPRRAADLARRLFACL